MPASGAPGVSPSAGGGRGALEFQPGDRVAERYEVRHRIGQGGMGVVYLAQDTLLGEEVALKFMRPELLRTEKARRLFLQEALVTRRLRHEHIVAVHDVSLARGGVLYISMEHAAGDPLRSILRRHRTERRLIDVRFAVSVAAQMLAGLEYAHRYVIHRDIKPENVIIGANERVKLLDFGLAKAVEEDMAATGAATEGERREKRRVVGTLLYAAPEQSRFQPLDHRVDVYATGLVLRELLALRTPSEPLEKMGQVRRDVSPSVMRVLEKALAEDRDARWQTAGAFRRALEEAYEESYRPPASPTGARASAGEASTEGMAWFSGGRFLMGNSGVREESPEEEVEVAPFWMDRHPVTVAEYRVYLEATGAPPPRYWNDADCNGAEQPVVGVSWHEAAAYARWAGKSLPTEAQWEFAARGRENRRHPWGNLSPDSTRCNFGEHIGGTSMVTLYEDGRTPEGLYDMAGNVFEWTLDPFAPYEQIRKQPEAAAKTPRRAARGGCWRSGPGELTTTARRGFFPETQSRALGFRCVLGARV